MLQNWCMSFTAKLRFKALEVYLLQIPDNLLPGFNEFEVSTKLPTKGFISQGMLFTKDKSTLDKWFPKIADKLADEALFWIAYPKKTGSIKTDMTRDNGWDSVFAKGYDPVMQVAIDKDWSALRFRRSEAIGPKLRDVPMSERKTEGIDYVNKTVQLPDDAEAALKKQKGLLDFFYSISYSHKKEYAMAIAEAKKIETRQRRIDNMVIALQKMKADKDKKNKK